MMVKSSWKDALVYIKVALGAMHWMSKLLAQILHL